MPKNPSNPSNNYRFVPTPEGRYARSSPPEGSGVSFRCGGILETRDLFTFDHGIKPISFTSWWRPFAPPRRAAAWAAAPGAPASTATHPRELPGRKKAQRMRNAFPSSRRGHGRIRRERQEMRTGVRPQRADAAGAVVDPRTTGAFAARWANGRSRSPEAADLLKSTNSAVILYHCQTCIKPGGHERHPIKCPQKQRSKTH